MATQKTVKPLVTEKQQNSFMYNSKNQPIPLRYIVSDNEAIRVVKGATQPKPQDQDFVEWLEIARKHYHAQYTLVADAASYIPLIADRKRIWGYTKANYASFDQYAYATMQLIKDTQTIMNCVANLDRAIARTLKLFMNANSAIDNENATQREVASLLSKALVKGMIADLTIDNVRVVVDKDSNVQLFIPLNKTMPIVFVGNFDKQAKLRDWIESRMVQYGWNKTMRNIPRVAVIESQAIPRDQEIAATPKSQRTSSPIVNTEKPVSHPSPAQRGKRGKPADVSLVNAR